MNKDTKVDWGSYIESVQARYRGLSYDEIRALADKDEAEAEAKRIAKRSEASAKTRPVWPRDKPVWPRDESGNVYDAADTSGAAGYWTGVKQ